MSDMLITAGSPNPTAVSNSKATLCIESPTYVPSSCELSKLECALSMLAILYCTAILFKTAL